MSFAIELNSEQKQVVCAPFGHQLVLAGAGSGKTRVLVHRIAWIVEERQVSPYNIMAVTFTNKAAKDMIEKIKEAALEPIGYVKKNTNTFET